MSLSVTNDPKLLYSSQRRLRAEATQIKSEGLVSPQGLNLLPFLSFNSHTALDVQSESGLVELGSTVASIFNELEKKM